MIQTPTEEKAKPARDEYIVVKTLVWQGRQREPGDRITFAHKGSHENRDRWLGQGRLRALTVEERAAVAPAKPRGLVAQAAATATQVQMVPLAKIRPDPTQPRKTFAPEAMAELVASIQAIGVEQAILVRPRPPGKTEWYEIVYGERRWRAAQAAGLTEIPAKVRDLSDIDAAEKQAIENLERAELLPLELAAQYRKLLDLPGYGMERLEAATGHKRNTIYGKLKLLELPEAARVAVERGDLPEVTAERIGRLKGDVQRAAVKAILGSENRDVLTDKKVAPDRECQQIIERVVKEHKKEDERAAERARLVKEGYRVIGGLEGREILHWNGGVSPNCGWVAAKDVCPRDPKGRTWAAVLKGSAVRACAVIAEPHNQPCKGVLIYQREECNEALKKLGLWDAAGSEKAKEKAEQQRKREQGKRDRDAMNADVARIVEEASRGQARQIRGVLLAAVRVSLPHWENAGVRFVAERRGITGSGQKTNLIEKLAEHMSNGELLGLVAELCTLHLGGGLGEGNNCLLHGRRKLRTLLQIDDEFEPGAEDDGESAGARTREDAVAAAA